MSSSTVYKYRVWCDTDSKWEYVWRDENEAVPSLCPVNTGHTIDTAKTSIVEQSSTNVVKVQEEEIPTGGHFATTTIKIDVDATTGWKETDISFPFPIGMLSAEFQTDASMEGDEVECSVSPDTIVGTITSDVAVDDVIVSVSQTVIDNSSVGQFIKLYDGTNTNAMGRIISVDSVNLTITLETPATDVFLASTPTYVQLTVKFVYDYVLGVAGRKVLGDGKIGASHVPANKVIRARYNNISGTAKLFTVQMEYLY